LAISNWQLKTALRPLASASAWRLSAPYRQLFVDKKIASWQLAIGCGQV